MYLFKYYCDRNYGGCSKEFGNLTDYTQHVLLEHKLKVVGSTMTNLLMKYDRENCTGNDYTTGTVRMVFFM